MALSKGDTVTIIEANDERILFEEYHDGHMGRDAKIYRITPDEVRDGWPPSLTIHELRPKEASVR